jgi:two-component system response regulator
MRSRPYVLYAEDNFADTVFFRRAFGLLDMDIELIHHSTGIETRDFLLSRLEAQQSLPCLIISDIKMPGLTGLELLEFIRSHPGLSHLPVVLMSASAEIRDIEQAYDYHTSAYIVKPSRYRQLKKLVSALVTFWVRYNRTAA